MNHKMIRYILGQVMVIIGALLLFPVIVSVFYREKVGFLYLIIALSSMVLGKLIAWKRPKNSTIYIREGCVSTALSWILMSILGALPLFISREIPSFTDALFETISGFTTTGASILQDVEALSKTALFWRSFTHWIGGMGVLVFLLAVVPLSGGSNINLMKAESPGPVVGKLVPKIKHTARILYIIYFALTVIEAIFFLCGGYSLYEALTTSFATAGTGGFGIYADSLGSFSTYGKWVASIFMILFGINFNFYYLLLMKQFGKAVKFEEVRGYLAVILVSSVIICINIMPLYNSVGEGITDSVFQVASIITTTGFSTADFDLWPTTSKLIIFVLMFIGACAGSTGGGIKVSRFQILIKTVRKEFNSLLHPKNIKKIQVDGKAVEHETVRTVNVYFFTFILLYFASVFILSFEGKDLVTTLTAVAATINNIGPGLSGVGPTSNFYDFTILSKYVMMFDMLAGRLELFPLLILFHPGLYKGAIKGSLPKR